MIHFIQQHRADLDALCRKHQVKTLELFGSAADGTFDPATSNVDFLLEFLPSAAGSAFHGYFELKEDLERLLGRSVDLLMPQAIRNRYLLAAVNQQRTLLYAA
ncbi:MAG: nucleotidyltransferase domain-containing protein [Pirellulaceae bacterium]